MADYIKSTNFAIKDGLTTGDPSKRIKGTEIDVELVAVASAISSKADGNSPSLTGVPTAPTAVAGTNNTQIASTAFVNTAVINATNSLGSMSTQNANAVNITGGTISGASVNSVTVGSNASGAKTVSSGAPFAGSDGDVWYQI